MSHEFLQFCYVTNDFDRAVRELQSTHGMGAFKEMRELHMPTGPDREAIGHFGLAFKAGTQFEVIQPLEGDVGIYTDSLSGSAFQLQFHHIGYYTPSPAVFQTTLSSWCNRWHVPIDVEGFGGHYAYADARLDKGHYVEIFCFPEDSPAIDAPRY